MDPALLPIADAIAGDDRVSRGLERTPRFVRRSVEWLREPPRKWVRWLVAILLIAGSALWFLPVLGLWMLPLGLALMSEEIPPLKGWLERLACRIEDRVHRLKRWWRGRSGPRKDRSKGHPRTRALSGYEPSGGNQSMSATDTLYFPPTGEETSYYLLVTVSQAHEGLRGRIAIEAPSPMPEGAEHPPSYPEKEGDLAVILKEAGEYAALNGYPLRVAKPADVEFPPELGTYAERQIR